MQGVKDLLRLITPSHLSQGNTFISAARRVIAVSCGGLSRRFDRIVISLQADVEDRREYGCEPYAWVELRRLVKTHQRLIVHFGLLVNETLERTRKRPVWIDLSCLFRFGNGF